jgi:hypothetical protein
VRLTRALHEALKQQTATSEVLGVISSSPGELQPVFKAILANAKRLCEAQFGILYLSDGDMLRFGADVGTPPKFAISPRVRLAVEKAVTVEPVGEFTLKGIRRPMLAYNVLGSSPSKPN